jgi:hypothetical protein
METFIDAVENEIDTLQAELRDLRGKLAESEQARKWAEQNRCHYTERALAFRRALVEIRDLARTGLPPAEMPAEYWPEHKCNRIAGIADHALTNPAPDLDLLMAGIAAGA